MKIVFVHDHKFRKINNEVYSPGGLSNDILTRYTNIFGKVNVISRIILEKQVRDTYSKIINPLIKIEDSSCLYKRIKEADAVIIRLPSINGFKAAYFSKKLNKPYLVEVVGCVKDAYLNYNIFGKICAYPAYFLMKKIVYNSKYTLYVTKEFLEKRYPCRGYTIAVSDVELMDSNEFKNKEIKKDKLILGTLAAIDVSYKGQEYVIKAIPYLEKKLNIKIEYQLVGGGDSTYLFNIAEKYNVKDKVIFKGTFPHNEIFNWLKELDCYIQSSIVEGLPRALIEAMSQGLPCIASDCGGNPELLESEFLISIKNKEKIPFEIVRVLEKLYIKGLYKEQARRNYNISNTNYNNLYLNKLRNNFYYKFKKNISDNIK